MGRFILKETTDMEVLKNLGMCLCCVLFVSFFLICLSSWTKLKVGDVLGWVGHYGSKNARFNDEMPYRYQVCQRHFKLWKLWRFLCGKVEWVFTGPAKGISWHYCWPHKPLCPVLQWAAFRFVFQSMKLLMCLCLIIRICYILPYLLH